MGVDSVVKIFNTLSLSELKVCRDELDKIIKAKRNLTTSLSPSDFVDYYPDFVGNNSVQHQTILSELALLGFNPTSVKTATKWLTSTGEEYVWSSSSGHLTVKEPIDMAKCPAICHLMHDINTQFGCSLNSCLASYYKSGESNTRYHSDDETSLDQSQGLYVVSFGAERVIDLHPEGGDKRFKADYSLKVSDCSLYIMKPGCQDNFVHRVRAERAVKDSRYSLSFRCMLPKKSSITSPNINQSVGSVPSAGLNQHHTLPANTPSCQHSSPHVSKPKKRKTTVIFGTSITKFIRPNKLGFRGRKVVNMSQSGAKIRDVSNNVRVFYETNEAACANDIEKIIFSLGTNDIKHSRFGVQHLKKYLVDLINMTKDLFPAAIVLFQCCLPIKCVYPYIARNVLDFNALLKELCLENNCVYIDCFVDFLTSDRIFRNNELYHDWLHLNNRGVGVLSTWLKFIINENSFDRVVNNMLGIYFN